MLEYVIFYRKKFKILEIISKKINIFSLQVRPPIWTFLLADTNKLPIKQFLLSSDPIYRPIVNISADSQYISRCQWISTYRSTTALMCRTVKYAWIVICQLMHDRSDDEEDPTLLWINTSDRRTDERPVAPAPAGRPVSQAVVMVSTKWAGGQRENNERDEWPKSTHIHYCIMHQ